MYAIFGFFMCLIMFRRAKGPAYFEGGCGASSGKEDRMTIRDCLRCRSRSLVHNGGFWSCATCGYAITQTALCVDHTRASDHNERGKGATYAAMAFYAEPSTVL